MERKIEIKILKMIEKKRNEEKWKIYIKEYKWKEKKKYETYGERRKKMSERK